MLEGQNRPFPVYSQKSVFSGALSILSISLPKFDQHRKGRHIRTQLDQLYRIEHD
jgi:hypothetical protein